ncbi:hypothetical protein SAMN05216370_0040 [Pseudomonas peli]|jgi:uncharacterized membrane protein|uniref:Activator of Hsp90 ATPase homolog 1-like protein n=1 Tax=Pseudomonas peli TaxID=592361 RepID=A0AB37ZD46_9PSED|nr:hypothetical protein [Pseudomonas peli]MBA4289098.1 hypothetical protein [Pseudomonas sp.]NMZ71398.1 hypothetical protein [Pseudomonas peli]TXG97352.1 MAG: hypothetical protein E6R08_07015 [Nevskiaceae bacterium]SCW89520.1 hypothetical protein SAMN05216370_0040 [Pseudomonas peli]
MQNVPATVFYFPTADALKAFHRFDVTQTHVSQGGDSVALWTVTGYDRNSGQNTALADFHARGMAETFRDMCAVVSG